MHVVIELSLLMWLQLTSENAPLLESREDYH